MDGIEKIFIGLGFKVDKKGLKQAENSIKRFGKSLNQSFGSRQMQQLGHVGKVFGSEFSKLMGGKGINAKALGRAAGALGGALGVAAGAASAIVTSFITATAALDRMIDPLSKANQQMLNFSNQTGISIGKLNSVAGAAMLSDYNIELNEVAQSLFNIQSNLANIRIGKGNIEPFQLLGISPIGKDAAQVIEDIRQAIVGVDDMMAVNILQQMGISPNMLSMLRLTREEYKAFQAEAAKFQLNKDDRKSLNLYSLEIKKMHMELSYLKDKVLIALIPLLQKMMKIVTGIARVFSNLIRVLFASGRAIRDLGMIITGILLIFAPVQMLIDGIILAIQDIWTYFNGGESYFGDFINGIKAAIEDIMENGLLEYLDKVIEKLGQIGKMKNAEGNIGGGLAGALAGAGLWAARGRIFGWPGAIAGAIGGGLMGAGIGDWIQDSWKQAHPDKKSSQNIENNLSQNFNIQSNEPQAVAYAVSNNTFAALQFSTAV